MTPLAELWLAVRAAVAWPLLAQQAEATSWWDRLSRLGAWIAELPATIAGGVSAAWVWGGTPSGRWCVATLLGGVGLWLLLPGRRFTLRLPGAALAGMSAVVLLQFLPPTGVQVESLIFWALAGVTVAAAVGTITARSPVYSAIWFALTLLGTGGLFLVNGAQFLGVATVAVYAGAIVVTFLFVVMLAQPEGHAFYDRISWGEVASLLGCLAGAALAGGLIWASSQLQLPTAEAVAVAAAPLADEATELPAAKLVLAAEHVATVGREVFSRQLVAVLVAGALLLAALVGAVAMAAHSAQRRAAGTIQTAGGSGRARPTWNEPTTGGTSA